MICDGGERYLGTYYDDRWLAANGFDIAPQSGKVVAAINVQPLHSYFKRLFQYYPDLRPLSRFVPPEALEPFSWAQTARRLEEFYRALPH